MPTMRDVANRAGVSTATVSYVLNDSAAVTAETRARVLAAAEALRYQPNHSARALRTRSRTLGLVVPALAERLLDEAAAEVLAGLSETAARHGYYLLLASAADSDDELALVERLARSGRVDGLVLLDLQLDDARVTRLASTNVPWVAGGADAGPAQRSVVAFDYHAGVAQALDYLGALGHQAIACITPPSDLIVGDALLAAYLDWHQAAGREPNSGLVLEAGHSSDAGYLVAQELLASEEPFTALLVGSDTLAVGVLHALTEAGLAVPTQISLIGIGDLPVASHMQPALTTLRAPRRRQGSVLAERLIAAIEGTSRAQDQAILLPFQLIRRGSTAPAQQLVPVHTP